MEDSYSFTALGINTERIERKAEPKPDLCYAFRLSAIDSDSEDGGLDASGAATAVGGIPLQSVPSPEPAACAGTPLVYDGDPITIGQGEGAWVPVVAVTRLGKEGRNKIGMVSTVVHFPVLGVPSKQCQAFGKLPMSRASSA